MQDGRSSNRLFYLAIPPNMFVNVTRCAKRSAYSESGWTRVIVEKPFGHDTKSSRELTRGLQQYLTEDEIFRYTFLTCEVCKISKCENTNNSSQPCYSSLQN